MPRSTSFVLLLSCGLGGDGMKNLGTCLYMGGFSVDCSMVTTNYLTINFLC